MKDTASPIKALSVSQLNRYVKSRLEEDYRLKDLCLSGEISNLTHHFRSGHFYFVLKDASAAVKAVMFRSNAQQVPFTPAEGMRVIVRCSVSLYERDGSFQVYVREMYPDGVGGLYLAFEQLKARLREEGLFDEALKRPIPAFPETVGIVTSPTGAALQDLLQIIGRRWPMCRVVLSPATVQGAGAAGTVIRALRALEEQGMCDVVIVGRGGGSLEDLWCFNDEGLARAVRGCQTPVISAVGHETDFTICDFAADLRAPTPSAAAELAVPDWQEVLMRLMGAQEQLLYALERGMSRARERVELCARRIEAASPRARLEEAGRLLGLYTRRLPEAMEAGFRQKGARLDSLAQLLGSLSPLRILARGYGALYDGAGSALVSADGVQPGDMVRVRLCDGEIEAAARKITKYSGEDIRRESGKR